MFSNNLGTGIRASDFQVRQGVDSPNAGEFVQVAEVEVRRNLVFLRLATPVTLARSLEVTVGSTIRDQFGQNFVAATIDVFGISVSDPSTGQFGRILSGNSARVIASGFEAGETVSITGVNGQAQQTLGQVTATENGTISGFFSIQFPVGGPYTIIATGESGRQHVATFDVVSA